MPVIRLPYVQVEGSIKLAYYSGNHYNALVSAIHGNPLKKKDGNEAHESEPQAPGNLKEGCQSNGGQREGLGV